MIDPEKAEDALRVIKSHNHIRNDRDAYLYRLTEWALGEVDERPDPVEYGLEAELTKEND